MSEQTMTEKPHAIAVKNREIATVTGVSEVLNFDEEGIMLKTSMGTLGIDGEDLRITRLDLDRQEVDFEGKINGFMYAQQAKRKGLFRKN
ncbi:MAG: sporulation protein YabP [Clostridiales bacterium]|nr:sporulation protein YabP [Clostridiales bacterium]